MVSASPYPPAGSRRPRPEAPLPAWKKWLVLGLCFGLGYGLTQRLVRLHGDEGPGGGQSFGVREFPGTTLDSLRQKFGAADQEIRGDLDLLELEKQRSTADEAARRNQATLEERDRQEKERAQREADRNRLEALNEPSPLPDESPLPPLETPPAPTTPQREENTLPPVLPETPPAPQP